MRKINLIILLSFLAISSYAQSEIEIMKKISENISKMKNASYTHTIITSEPDDSVFINKPSSVFEVYCRKNEDEYFKCNFFWGMSDAPNKIRHLYIDGVNRIIEWDKNQIIIDSLENSYGLPYKRALVPVIIGIQGIIDYGIANFASIQIHKELKVDSSFIKITFPDKVIEYINYKPWIVHCPGIEKNDEHSSYTIWYDNQYFPYKILREVNAERSLSTISELISDTITNKDLLSVAYIPNNFNIIDAKNGSTIEGDNPLENKTAPNWELLDPKINKIIKLNEIKAKVILINFTGIGCGHCKEAIPFIKQLKNDYIDNLEVLSIEIFVDNAEYILHYLELNQINYTYLIGTKSVKNDYSIGAAPQFFILDEDKKVSKVIVGYRKDVTDKLIIQKIEELIN
jgi:thiol-disulfide isomerase/thioredoxin